MSDQEEEKEVNLPTEAETNEEESTIYDNISLLPESGQSFDQLSLWLHTTTSSSSSFSAVHNISDIFNVLSNFDIPEEGIAVGKSVPPMKETGEKGETSGAKRMSKYFSGSTEISDKFEEGVHGGDLKSMGECIKQKRTRSTHVHNMKERLRRQRLKEKIEAFQEIVPNCSKKDKASTLDDTINYIKALQTQVQVMSMGEGFTMFQSPFMLQCGGHHGMQIPAIFPYMNVEPWRGFGMARYGMGMSAPFNCPMNQLALHSPWSSTSGSSTSGLPILGEKGVCSNPLASSPFTTSTYTWTPLSMSSLPFGSKSTLPGERNSQSVPSSCTSELCQMPAISQLLPLRGSTARVLPSQIILPEVRGTSRVVVQTQSPITRVYETQRRQQHLMTWPIFSHIWSNNFPQSCYINLNTNFVGALLRIVNFGLYSVLSSFLKSGKKRVLVMSKPLRRRRGLRGKMEFNSILTS
ncbi:transcription factor APG-like [Abeliophyllum distichum]|uniref:Transcription factor APG-like n=1 Tax=Abeliophyllum distichum TaxID=126358 RepID=A0ABD1TW17_9LAMI